MDRTVAPGDRKSGFYDISVLQYIIRDQQTSRRQKSQNIRQEIDILPLGRIHEDHIVSTIQFFQYLCGIAFQKSDFVFSSIFIKIFSGYGDSFFIFFYGCDMAIRRRIFTHK